MAEMEPKIYFVKINGGTLFKKHIDNRSIIEWILDMGYTFEQYANSIHGYITATTIQFWYGANNDPCQYVPEDMLQMCDQVRREEFNVSCPYHLLTGR